MTARPLTPADLYAMGDYIREHGFSPDWKRPMDCGCFLHAAAAVTGNHLIGTSMFANQPIWDLLGQVVGTGYSRHALEFSGWTEGCAEDAATACYIAGDILACEQARRR